MNHRPCHLHVKLFSRRQTKVGAERRGAALKMKRQSVTSVREALKEALQALILQEEDDAAS